MPPGEHVGAPRRAFEMGATPPSETWGDDSRTGTREYHRLDVRGKK